MIRCEGSFFMLSLCDNLILRHYFIILVYYVSLSNAMMCRLCIIIYYDEVYIVQLFICVSVLIMLCY
jgi:hypothetical protein